MDDHRLTPPCGSWVHAGSRRRLIAGGFAAAAGGLILPSPRGIVRAKLAKDIEIAFRANDTGPFRVEVWQEDPNDGGSFVRKWSERSIDPGRAAVFTGNENKMAIVILRDRQSLSVLPVFFYFRNPRIGKPDALIAQGKWGRNGPKDVKDVYADQSMAVGDQIFIEGYEVQRREDARNHKVFLIEANGGPE